SAEDFDECGFARAIFAAEGDHFAAAHVEAHVVQCDHAGKAFANPAHLQQWSVAHLSAHRNAGGQRANKHKMAKEENIQHPTFNIEHPTACVRAVSWMLVVRCWMLDVRRRIWPLPESKLGRTLASAYGDGVTGILRFVGLANAAV